MKLETEWVGEYGKIYGMYQGTEAHLVVADPEVIQQICIKDFDSLQNHEDGAFNNIMQKKFLFTLQGDFWKKVRALMTPTFTSGKIKRMFKFLDICADDLIDCFNEQLPSKEKDGEGERYAVVNAKDMYSLFTMDAITTCCYGLKLHREGTSNLKSFATRNDFVRMAMDIFDFSFWRVFTALMIPKPILKLLQFEIVPYKLYEPLVAKVNVMIANRRKPAAKKFDDYLQLLVDAKLGDQMELNELDSEENHHAGLTSESLIQDQNKMVNEIRTKSGDKVTLTDFDILSNAVFLIAVGLETTATLLTHVSYALAFHQSIQQKLYDEVSKIAEYREDTKKYSFNYDSLTSCQYLDSVLSETLRNLTPVIQIDRVANSDYRIEKYNIDVPKGSKLRLAYHAVHNSPDYWDEPHRFDPERFMPENKHKIVPGSYCPFGLGPRHCIGMRFSLTEAKLSLAKIMMNFKFEPAPGTSFPPEPALMIAGLTRYKKPIVKFVPRVKSQVTAYDLTINGA